MAAVGAEPTWGQFQSGQHFWSKEAFVASSTVESKRMFIFPGVLPTSVPDLVGIENQVKHADGSSNPACNFTELPLFAGRALVRSYQAAVIEAIEDGDKLRVRKLLEAGLSVTIRMRLSDDRNERILDAMASAESVRVLKKSMIGSDSFMDFVAAVCELDETKRNIGGSQKQLKDSLGPFGITYGGKPLSDMAIKAIKAIAPFAAVGAVRVAFRNLETVCQSMSDQSKLMRICQVVQSRNPNNAQEANKAMIAVLTNFKVALWTGSHRDQESSVTFLVGGKKQALFFVAGQVWHLAMKQYRM